MLMSAEGADLEEAEKLSTRFVMDWRWRNNQRQRRARLVVRDYYAWDQSKPHKHVCTSWRTKSFAVDPMHCKGATTHGPIQTAQTRLHQLEDKVFCG